MKIPSHVDRLVDKYITKDGGEGTGELPPKPREFSSSITEDELMKRLEVMVENVVMRCLERIHHDSYRDRSYRSSYEYRPMLVMESYERMIKGKF